MTLPDDINSPDLDTAQAAALAQFEVWSREGGVVVDTETTGLAGRVWEVAAVPIVSARTPAPLLAFVCDLEGDVQWESAALRMHIDRLRTLNCLPPFRTYADQLLTVLENNVCVAYNAEFDQSRLEDTLAQDSDHEAQFPSLGCVMTAYAPLAGEWSERRQCWRGVSLERACEQQRVDISDLQRHTAYGDAVAVVRLIQAIAWGAAGTQYIQ